MKPGFYVLPNLRLSRPRWTEATKRIVARVGGAAILVLVVGTAVAGYVSVYSWAGLAKGIGAVVGIGGFAFGAFWCAVHA